jgi:hypothetical protein
VKKLAIVGGAPSTEYEAPFDDPEFDIWVHGNQMGHHIKRRITRIFEIHNDLSEHEDVQRYVKFLVDQNKPLVVGPGFPAKGDHISLFPVEEANGLMGQHLTSTPAYMMAMAILEGYDYIGIYGVDMSVDDHEYFYQRPSMYAWIAYAKAKGIEIFIPEKSGLFKDSYIEGDFGGKPDLGLPPFTSDEFTKIAELHQRKIDELENRILELRMQMNAHAGSKQTYERLSKVARGIEAGAEIKTLTENVVLK